MTSDIVVVGHSFVRKLRQFAVENGQHNLDLDRNHFRVFFHGRGGGNLINIYEEVDAVCNLQPCAVILDIGANDLDRKSRPCTVTVASNVVRFALD